uniref:CV_2116 domain-containing protein n=1 Tax=Cupriavidus gilardii TaxID=82541 RepID=UPI0024789265|nr:hypothetical protein [Cupriavidus gilardii]WDE72681.1 hypothetical protein [Cupriavidus gilardii]
MEPYDYHGYRIIPGAVYHSEIRRWMAAGEIRNAEVADGHAEPARTPVPFGTEQQARLASARQAEAMIRHHRAGSGGLVDLDRERQWKNLP